jgi:hypothetical protein
MSTNKLRVIQDFEKLSKEIQEQIKLTYPNGFSQHLIQFTNKDGRLISALPFETDEKIYLVRMTTEEARDIIYEDSDYDDDGILKEATKEQYADKYAELDYISDSYHSEKDDDFEDSYDDKYEEEDEEEDDDID